jgi:hypothetical protein
VTTTSNDVLTFVAVAGGSHRVAGSGWSDLVRPATEIVDPDVFEIIRTAEALIADLRLRVERSREIRGRSRVLRADAEAQRQRFARHLTRASQRPRFEPCRLGRSSDDSAVAEVTDWSRTPRPAQGVAEYRADVPVREGVPQTPRMIATEGRGFESHEAPEQPSHPALSFSREFGRDSCRDL